MPEYFSENLETKHVGDEVHPGESVEEKISLSERFGLWISFYPFSQDDYLAAVAGWLAAFGVAAPKSARDGEARAPRSPAVRAAARLAQRPRRVAVRARLRGRRGACRSARARSLRDRPHRSGCRGRHHAADGRCCSRSARPARRTPATGNFPAASSSPANRRAHALDRELAEELGLRGAARRAVARRSASSIRTRTSSSISFASSSGTASRSATTARRSRGRRPARFDVAPLLPANTLVLRALLLPRSTASRWPQISARPRFSRARESRSKRGLRLIQLREKDWPLARQRALARSLLALARPYGARVLLNGTAANARAWGCDGVHWTSAALAAATERPADLICAASCHTRDEVALAAVLALDFALVGPVRPTPTHPGATVLGWEGFAAVVTDTAVPVFALGGLERADLDTAIAHGAHGVALRRGAWA